MINPEHLEILKQGIEAWNKWRHEHRGIRPSLRGAALTGVTLRGANLRLTDLRHADLRGADLRGANLFGANLGIADLSGADLSGVNLRRADLFAANLSSTDLTGADIGFANLNRARLTGTNVTKARAEGTLFADVDFREVLGLELIEHLGPSAVSAGTIYLSEGKIPEAFLRGSGVPESLIVQIPALTTGTQLVQFYSCFISYSSKDHDFAERLNGDLQDEGVRCWFAPEDLKIGERFRDRIDESIRLHDKLLLILSVNSVSSQWVGDEVEAAFEREQKEGRTVLFPIRIDDAVMEGDKAWAATIRRTRHVGDFTRWKEHDSYAKAFERLLRDLKAGA